MASPTDDLDMTLVGTGPAHRRVREALQELFSGDGSIYLVAGFFTYNGYTSLRPNIVSFLERSPENRLTIVVGPSSDQFSPQIARDLWALDVADRVSIYKYPRGLHAKLYLRDGPIPRVILGSANLTQVGFRYNVELGIEMTGSDPDHPRITPFVEWVEELVATAEPMRRRDLIVPVLIGNAVINWTNKGRLLSPRYMAMRAMPIALLVIGIVLLIWIVA